MSYPLETLSNSIGKVSVEQAGNTFQLEARTLSALEWKAFLLYDAIKVLAKFQRRYYNIEKMREGIWQEKSARR